MNMAVEHQSGGQVARPLRVLVPLIKEDLRQGNEAAERAGMPYYEAAGEKMLEAKPQMSHAEFTGWLKRNFNISYTQASTYMKLAHAVATETSFRTQKPKSLNEFIGDIGRSRPNAQTWHDPVKQILGKVDTETLNLRQGELKRVEEREEQRKLALQLIDIGYKALATKLHPDKGGSRDAMARLNQVRDRLKAHA